MHFSVLQCFFRLENTVPNIVFGELDNNTPGFGLQVIRLWTKAVTSVNLRRLHLYFEIVFKNVTNDFGYILISLFRYTKDNKAVPSRVLVLFIKIVNQTVILVL